MTTSEGALVKEPRTLWYERTNNKRSVRRLKSFNTSTGLEPRPGIEKKCTCDKDHYSKLW